MRLKYLRSICDQSISRKELYDQIESAPSFVISLIYYPGYPHSYLTIYSKVGPERYLVGRVSTSPQGGIETIPYHALLHYFGIEIDESRYPVYNNLSMVAKSSTRKFVTGDMPNVAMVDVYNCFLIYKKRLACQELNDEYPYLKTIEYLKGIENVDVSMQYLYLLINLTKLEAIDAKSELEQLILTKIGISMYLKEKNGEYRLKLINEIKSFK